MKGPEPAASGPHPAAKTGSVVRLAAPVKIHPAAGRVPEFVFVPTARPLPWNRRAPAARDIQPPHSVRLRAVFVAELDDLRVLRVDEHVVDPKFLAAQHLLRPAAGGVRPHDRAGG